MTDDPEHLALQYLRSIEAKLDAMLSTLDRLCARLDGVEEQVAGLRRDLAAHRDETVEARLGAPDRNPRRPH